MTNQTTAERRMTEASLKGALSILRDQAAEIEAAKDMILELQTAMLSVQRSAFDAGYDAGKEGRVREWAYKEWSHT